MKIERFFINSNLLVEHIKTGTTFNSRAEAEKWLYEIYGDIIKFKMVFK